MMVSVLNKLFLAASTVYIKIIFKCCDVRLHHSTCNESLSIANCKIAPMVHARAKVELQLNLIVVNHHHQEKCIKPKETIVKIKHVQLG